MQIVHKDEHETETVSWEAAVSSWMDGEGEVRADELDSPYGRQVWDTYHLIGDVLRTQELAIKPSDMFYARLSRAIDDEPPIVAPQSLMRPPWRAGLSGLAVAAAVVTVVWIALPWLTGVPEDSLPGPATQLASAASAASDDDDAALLDYLDAHQGLVGVVPVRQVSYGAGVQP